MRRIESIKPVDPTANRCGNCGAELTGDYCAACGQRRSQRLSLKRSLRDGVGQLSEFDFAFARTFRGLSSRPGPTAIEYIDGRRASFTHPFRYAFLLVTAYVLAIHLFDLDIRAPGAPLDSEKAQAAVRVIASLLAYLFFPSIMVVAGLQRWLARQERFNYSETLAYCAYCHSHITLWSTLVGATIGFQSLAGIGLLLGGQSAYHVWGLRGFYDWGYPRCVGVAVLLLLCSLVASNLFGLGVANLAALAGLI